MSAGAAVAGGTPASLWVPVAGAAAAFALNQAATHGARLRARWNVAINVHREATEAAIVLPAFRTALLEAVPRRLFAREPLLFLDDGSEGGVFKAFGSELKSLPPSVAAAAMLFFERYAFLSHMLLKLEGEPFRRLSLDRQMAVVEEVGAAARLTVQAAHRTRALCKLYLRGRYVPFLRTALAARLALAWRGRLRRLAAWWRAADRRTDRPGLKLPVRPWRPEIR